MIRFSSSLDKMKISFPPSSWFCKFWVGSQLIFIAALYCWTNSKIISPTGDQSLLFSCHYTSNYNMNLLYFLICTSGAYLIKNMAYSVILQWRSIMWQYEEAAQCCNCWAYNGLYMSMHLKKYVHSYFFSNCMSLSVCVCVRTTVRSPSPRSA